MADEGPPPCLGCRQPMQGKFVKALGGHWHLACFSCSDCGREVSSRYYDLGGKPFCEQDFYRKKNLLCHSCDKPITGHSLTALGKRWHLDHFRCATCNESLLLTDGSPSTFYEHDSRPYCRVDYALRHAARCGGCNTPIIDQFVSDPSGVSWHVSCYKLHRMWGLALPLSKSALDRLAALSSQSTAEAREHLAEVQDDVLERVSSMLDVLWMYEDAIATYVSESVVVFESGRYPACRERLRATLNALGFLISSVKEATGSAAAAEAVVPSPNSPFWPAITDLWSIMTKADKKDITTERLLVAATESAKAFSAVTGLAVAELSRVPVDRIAVAFDVTIRMLKESFPYTTPPPVPGLGVLLAHFELLFNGDPAFAVPASVAGAHDAATDPLEVEDVVDPKRHSIDRHDLQDELHASGSSPLAQPFVVGTPPSSSSPCALTPPPIGMPGETRATRSSSHLDDSEYVLVDALLRDAQSRSFSESALAASSSSTSVYLSELSALQLLLVKQLAVQRLSELLRDHYNPSELMQLIVVKRRKPLLSRIIGTFRKPAARRKRTEMGCFGVPLEETIDRTGVDARLGFGRGILRIPAFVEAAVDELLRRGLTTPGIFRRSGSTKRVNELMEAVSRSTDIKEVSLGTTPVIDLAILLKRFFRELPEPILTRKLYDLLLLSQKFGSEDRRQEVLHLLILLLPKSNRETLEALMALLRNIAANAVGDANEGTKMDEHNLATVMAPSLMGLGSSDKKDGIKTEENVPPAALSKSSDVHVSIQCVKMLIECAPTFATVPASFQKRIASADTREIRMSRFEL